MMKPHQQMLALILVRTMTMRMMVEFQYFEKKEVKKWVK